MTTAEFAALLTEARALEADVDPDNPESARRMHAANREILEARPTDPAFLAAQLRWLIDQCDGDAAIGPCDGSSDLDVMAHIADQLEAMAAA
jgi:hypothetical protein